MQSREFAQAPPQKPVTSKTANIGEQALDQLTELAAISWSVTANYTEQVKLTAKTAKAELSLSARSLTVAAGLVVCFAAGLILLWGSMLVAIGYLTFQLTGSLLIMAATLLLMQCIMLLLCWRSLRYVLSQVGFRHTWQQLCNVFMAKATEK
ncbi:hypothetical protein [Rheinheimera baltica]|uniref:hypothetical protein n=1 Tax=Rheinheimera baltica TaxID=67576 RepID=UPI000401AE68|nr:hypothetical protein [Rheinheimera baltica]